MFKTIIVGVDGREGGRDALALASRLAQLSDGVPIAVHALPDGPPGRALHLAAARDGADLIVIGSAHRGRIGRVLAGDGAAGTLHGAPCPVLVAPAGYADRSGRLATIGVGYDGSPQSRAALKLARDLARRCGSRLRIIEVVMPPEPGGAFPAHYGDWSEDARLRYEEAQQRVRAIVGKLDPLGTADVAVGDAASELASAGKHLDLLVVGSRNHGPIRRLMLGSTSTRLVHEAPCPVLVTARLAEDEAEDASVAAGAQAF